MMPHLRIRASAGTGKTFRLTDRIIELLLHGAAAEKIIALTFTRKSAAEFLNKTLQKLAKCASVESEASAFCARRNIAPARSCDDFLKVLRRVVEALDKIEFGTLDGFFFRVVSAFGAELGLGASLRLENETSQLVGELDTRRALARELDAEVLARELLRIPGRSKIDPLGTEFEILNDIERLHTLYPSASSWGDADQIWPKGCPWTAFEDVKSLPPDGAHEQVARAIEEFNAYIPGGKLNTAAKRFLENADDLLAGRPVAIKFGKGGEIRLSPTEREAVRDALGACVWRLLRSHLAQSRRWHRIGEVLHSIRARRMRTALRFADLPVLVERLAKVDSAHLQFRLDGWFDHWLLDEFQDTSRIQWRALEPLVDEVLQDASGARSFFYVGDVKQSIYRFRDGDPTLFDEIFQRYTKHAAGHIQDEPLGESRRSAVEVIDLVQKTFEPCALTVTGVDSDAANRWQAAWTQHSAHPENPAPGHVIHIAENVDNYWEKIAGVIRETQVLARPPLTCAILVRKNDHAQDAVRALAARGIAATTESSPHIAAESPVGVAILMASRLVADPGDAFARKALAMGPLGEPDVTFVPDALAAFHLYGAAGMVNAWLRKLRAALPESGFLASRPGLFRRAAREFDEQNNPSPHAWTLFLEASVSAESALTGTVQVMTIHKSKGLEFDLVFFPLMKDGRIDKRDGAGIFCGDERNLGPGTRPWILALLSEDLGAADPVFARAGQALRDRTTFDNLCALYVAETRARRALVVLTPE